MPYHKLCLFKRFSLYLCCCIFYSSTSFAEGGWYLGLGLGSGEVEVTGHDRSAQVSEVFIDNGLALSNASGAEKDGINTVKIFVAYKFSAKLALGLSYQDLGDTSGFFNTELSDGTNVNGSLRSDYEVVSVTGLVRLPLGKQFFLLAKAGLHFWHHEFQLNSTHLKDTETDKGLGLLYSIGLEYSVTRHWALRTEWARFDNIEDKEGIDVKAISLVYSF